MQQPPRGPSLGTQLEGLDRRRRVGLATYPRGLALNEPPLSIWPSASDAPCGHDAWSQPLADTAFSVSGIFGGTVTAEDESLGAGQ